MNDVAGWITIGTKMDTSKFDKQYAQLVKKAKDQEMKIDIQVKNVDEAKKQLEKLKKDRDKILEKKSEANRFFELETKSIEGGMSKEENAEFQSMIMKRDQYEQIGDKIKQINASINESKAKLDEENAKLKEIKENYNGIQQQIQGVNDAKEQFVRTKMFERVEGQLKGIGNSIKRVTRQIVHWGLAIFGIRSAFLYVRSAINTIAGDDEQLKTDIDYMKNAIAYTLEPVVRKIVDLAKQLLFYIAYIIKAWTGKNIFENANKSLDKANKKTQALKKQLAGFDEMNILSSGGSEDTGSGTPSFDLTNLEGQEVPKWIQWIADHGAEIIALIAGITAGLIAFRVLGLKPLMSLGIGIAVAGLVLAIQGLIDYLKDPSFENFGRIITGIGIAIAGVAIAFGAWPVAVAGAIVAVIGIIISKWEEIKSFLMDKVNWLAEKSDEIRKKFGDFVGDIYDTFVGGITLIVLGFDEMFNGLKQILDGIIKFISGVFKGDWKKAWEGIVDIFSGIFKTLKGIIDTVLGTIQATIGVVAAAAGNVIASVFKRVINAVLETIESVLNSPIRAVNFLIGIINKLPGVNMSKLQTFNLPRLAKGAIANYPGHGIPTVGGGATWAEAGREAYLPLTDQQVMSELGQSIGKYISVNATVPVYVGNRLVLRELKRIENEDAFAGNR